MIEWYQQRWLGNLHIRSTFKNAGLERNDGMYVSGKNTSVHLPCCICEFESSQEPIVLVVPTATLLAIS